MALHERTVAVKSGQPKRQSSIATAIVLGSLVAALLIGVAAALCVIGKLRGGRDQPEVLCTASEDRDQKTAFIDKEKEDSSLTKRTLLLSGEETTDTLGQSEDP